MFNTNCRRSHYQVVTFTTLFLQCSDIIIKYRYLDKQELNELVALYQKTDLEKSVVIGVSIVWCV